MKFIFVFLQCVLLVVLVFGEFGFEHPGKFGMDLGDLIVIACAYGLVLIMGLAWTMFEKSWLLVLVQLAIPLTTWAVVDRPLPVYSAADYQFLVTKPRSEAEAILGTRGTVTGSTRYRGRDCEFASYRGMTVYYVKGRVFAVVPDE